MNHQMRKILTELIPLVKFHFYSLICLESLIEINPLPGETFFCFFFLGKNGMCSMVNYMVIPVVN